MLVKVTGNDATPLWIPQIAMAVGAAVLFIAILDEFVLLVSGSKLKPVDSAEFKAME